METKLFEIRDKGTLAPALCTLMTSDDEAEDWMLEREGYGNDLILMTPLARLKSEYDPLEWGDRTFQTAHDYITDHWNELESGDVVDVEFILGERAMRKMPQRFSE